MDKQTRQGLLVVVGLLGFFGLMAWGLKAKADPGHSATLSMVLLPNDRWCLDDAHAISSWNNQQRFAAYVKDGTCGTFTTEQTVYYNPATAHVVGPTTGPRRTLIYPFEIHPEKREQFQPKVSYVIIEVPVDTN